MAHFDICAIGHIANDIIVDAGGRKRRAMGGAAFYAGVALQNLGLQTLVLSTAAEKDIPRFRAEFAKYGVEFQCAASAQTTSFENIYVDGKDQRVQRINAVARPFDTSDLDGVGADIFHFGPLTADEIPLGCFETLTGRGARISLDIQGFVRGVSDGAVQVVDWPRKAEALKFVHILKANRWEAAAVTNGAGPALAARRLARMGPGEVIVTLADRGAVLCVGQDVHDIPVTPVTITHDPTGCGDSFCAGYLFARHQGRSCLDAARFASVLAGQKRKRGGPFTGTARDVDAEMAR